MTSLVFTSCKDDDSETSSSVNDTANESLHFYIINYSSKGVYFTATDSDGNVIIEKSPYLYAQSGTPVNYLEVTLSAEQYNLPLTLILNDGTKNVFKKSNIKLSHASLNNGFLHVNYNDSWGWFIRPGKVSVKWTSDAL